MNLIAEIAGAMSIALVVSVIAAYLLHMTAAGSRAFSWVAEKRQPVIREEPEPAVVEAPVSGYGPVVSLKDIYSEEPVEKCSDLRELLAANRRCLGPPYDCESPERHAEGRKLGFMVDPFNPYLHGNFRPYYQYRKNSG